MKQFKVNHRSETAVNVPVQRVVKPTLNYHDLVTQAMSYTRQYLSLVANPSFDSTCDHVFDSIRTESYMTRRDMDTVRSVVNTIWTDRQRELVEQNALDLDPVGR
jgi:hypothetical protein